MVQIFAWNVHGCTFKISLESNGRRGAKGTVMKAIVFARAGEPREVLEIRNVAEPALKTGEVVVEVAARPIHPADLAFIRGAYRIRPTFPQVAGLSGVGRVVKGDPASGLHPGTRVAFRWPGAWAERVAVPFERAIALPEGVSDDDGAQLPMNPLTAWGLLDMANAKPGDWVGLTGPNSSVSHLVVSLSEMRGVRTLPIESTTEPGLAERVRSFTEGRGLAALLDSVGGSLIERLFGAMQPGGTIIAYGTMSDEPISMRNATLIYSNLTWRGFGIDRWLSTITAESRARMLEALHDAMRNKRLPLPVRARFELADFQRAVRSAQEPVPGKVLLR
jgi:NADPH:quinone reductase-like Zn-dependent oxidoreductase